MLNKLEILNLSKSYTLNEKEYNVLNNVNLTIKDNELVSLVGPSGAGKSTLLYIIGTLEKANSGTVILNEIQNNVIEKKVDLTLLSQHKLNIFRNKKLGFIFQFHHLLPEFTVLDNILMPIYIANSDIKEKREKALKLMAYAQIEGIKDKYPSQISGGEQQRAAILRAIINEPELLLADEPTGSLDSKNSLLIIELLKRIQEDYKITTIIATHSQTIAEASDRIVTINDGVIV